MKMGNLLFEPGRKTVLLLIWAIAIIVLFSFPYLWAGYFNSDVYHSTLFIVIALILTMWLHTHFYFRAEKRDKEHRNQDKKDAERRQQELLQTIREAKQKD